MVNFQALYLPFSKLNDSTLKLLYLLAALCDGRGSACSQDLGSNMSHLWTFT